MERGAATQGQVARQMAGAEAIEIKATVPDHQIRQALERFNLTESNDEERYVYFFDTPKLDLLGAGIIARARRVVGDTHDSTVKFRPVNPADVGQKWRRYPDFKIEADASESAFVKSASFSMPVLRGDIKRVAMGKKPISAIFTPAQMKFLEKTAAITSISRASSCWGRLSPSAGASRTPVARGRSLRSFGSAATASE